MKMSEYEERFRLSATKTGRWFQTNSDLFCEGTRPGCAKRAIGEATQSQLPQQLGEFLMSAAKRRYRRTVTVASTEHGTGCIAARLVGARSLLRFRRRNPSSSAVAEDRPDEVTWHRPGTEPALDELFRDVTMQLLMRRDGVRESDVRALLGELRDAREAAPGGAALKEPSGAGKLPLRFI